MSKWLARFIGSSLLPAAYVPEAFAMDVMDYAPSDYMCLKFADYIFDTYISPDAILFLQLCGLLHQIPQVVLSMELNPFTVT